jgi:hypothetical protein
VKAEVFFIFIECALPYSPKFTAMKKFFFSCVCLLVLSGHSYSQTALPNPSFEEVNADGSLRNWGNVYLQQAWIDSTGELQGDSIYLDFAYYFQTNEPYNGNWAVEMRNSYNYTQNIGTAGAIIADLDTVFSAWGAFETIPVSAYPTTLGFFYKHIPVNGDSASAEITVFDSLGNEIGFGRSILSTYTNAYVHNIAPITYTTSDVPAFAMVKFSNFYTEAPGLRQPSLGSRFLVDDVQLITTTGFDMISRKQLEVTAYPNPSSERVSIRRTSAEKALVNIVALNGQVVKQQTIQGELVDISLVDVSNGSYVIEVIAGEKSWKQQLLVQH